VPVVLRKKMFGSVGCASIDCTKSEPGRPVAVEMSVHAVPSADLRRPKEPPTRKHVASALTAAAWILPSATIVARVVQVSVETLKR
jgi:hypothetical protein